MKQLNLNVPILLTLISTWFGFSNPVYHLPLTVLVFPAALVWISLNSLSASQTWKSSWLAAGIAYAACLYWIYVPVHYYGGLPWWISLACPILTGLYLGLYPSIFSLAIYWNKDLFNWFWMGLFAGFTWACLEFLRGTLFSGLPWLNLAQAFSIWPWSIQVLELIGSTGTAGAIATLGAWIVLGMYKDKKAYLGAIVLALLISSYGAVQFDTSISGRSRLNVSLIQANISQDKKWDPKFQKQTVQKYLGLSKKEIEENNPELLIWPETAMPFYIQQSGPLRAKILDFAKKNNVSLLTGAPGFEGTKQKYKLFNRAYLINKQGKIIQHYGKEHLVPFGEYVHAQKYIPFLDTLVVGSKGFSSGLQISPLQLNDLDLGTLICYEIIFTGLVQKRVAQGANLLVNISNDAWFGYTAAPEQHLNQAVLRAIEQNRYVLRGTNTGFSAFIDPQGKILKKSSLLSKETLYSQKIFALQEKTFYHSHYTVLHFVYFLVPIALFLSAKILPPRGDSLKFSKSKKLDI